MNEAVPVPVTRLARLRPQGTGQVRWDRIVDAFRLGRGARQEIPTPAGPLGLHPPALLDPARLPAPLSAREHVSTVAR